MTGQATAGQMQTRGPGMNARPQQKQMITVKPLREPIRRAQGTGGQSRSGSVKNRINKVK